MAGQSEFTFKQCNKQGFKLEQWKDVSSLVLLSLYRWVNVDICQTLRLFPIYTEYIGNTLCTLRYILYPMWQC